MLASTAFNPQYRNPIIEKTNRNRFLSLTIQAWWFICELTWEQNFLFSTTKKRNIFHTAHVRLFIHKCFIWHVFLLFILSQFSRYFILFGKKWFDDKFIGKKSFFSEQNWMEEKFLLNKLLNGATPTNLHVHTGGWCKNI